MGDPSRDGTALDPHPDQPQDAFQVRHHYSIPQDHTVLEEAYQKNSKPDKAERAQIVSRVGLGEKEVQIWFQNRRQNDRRRSKPLQPHELVAHLRNHTASPLPLQRTSSPNADETSTSTSTLSPYPLLTTTDTIVRPLSRASSIHDLLNPTSSAETPTGQEPRERTTPPSSLEQHATTAVKEATPPTVDIRLVDGDQQADISEQASARKRDHAEMNGAHTAILDAPAHEQPVVPPRVKEPLARTSSMVRLAMTVDGAVKVRTNNEPTPSPEKPRAATSLPNTKAKAALARSKSAMNSIEVFRESGEGGAVKAGFGRSRDARTWEFYCDSNARDALSTQAEAETAGSAVSAINLIRSNSFKSRTQALSPSLSKCNPRPPALPKEGKPKLSRAKSSLGRLQGLDGTMELPMGKSELQGHERSRSGDSDKENWAPGTRTSEHPLRRTHPARQRPILQETGGMVFPDVSSSRKWRAEGGISGPSPNKERTKGDDLDCIQGLLSLSQGAWR